MSSKNLIYNRYDLIYDESSYFDIDQNGDIKRIYYHIEDGVADINVWARQISKETLSTVVKRIFESEYVYGINVLGSYNNYQGYLEKINDVMINLPDNQKELLDRLSPKTIASLKRKERRILDKCANCHFVKYELDIPTELVNRYFMWKRITHGTDYKMQASEYLSKYHVTHALEMKADENGIAVVFVNILEDTAYLENLSYDIEWGAYSPGFITYFETLKWLIEKNIKYFYLGKEGPDYKRHFGAQMHEAFWGYIYNRRDVENVNAFFKANGIKKIAMYGMGNVGKEFLRYLNSIDVDLIYGIDRKPYNDSDIKVYRIDDDLPECDAVLITMDKRNDMVEQNLKFKGMKYYYWRKLISGGAM